MAASAKTKKGRGTLDNLDSRFSEFQREQMDDGWFAGNDMPAIHTEVSMESPRTIIARNHSPDISFLQSINSYRGCEHGCIYCYARPSHAYLGLSPGLDFGTKLTVKPNAAALLRKELMAANYQCSSISLDTNTDPYQSLEQKHRITRELLEVFAEPRHPCTIVTKSAMVERDIDLLQQLAKDSLVRVDLSITTLDKNLAGKLEPRASSPQRRLQAITTLHQANIPASVLVAPIIPVLTDTELEKILNACHEAGAQAANYILVRLPREVTPLFESWLHDHFPDKANHVMNRIRDSRNGKTNEPRFGHRMRGHGFYADMIQKRFAMTVRKLGLNQHRQSLN